MTAKDFQLDTDGDLLISGGDFVIGLSDQQNIEDIIQAFPGWWKQSPQLGVGIRSYVKGGDIQELEQSVLIQLTADGFKVNNPRASFINDKLTIEPNAERV